MPRAGGGTAAGGISTNSPDAGGRQARRLDERAAGNAARHAARTSRHHYQRRGRGEPGGAQKICEWPSHGHAGLSQRAGRGGSAAAACGVDAGFRRKTIAPGDSGDRHRDDLFSGRRRIFLDRLEAGLVDCDGTRRFVFVPPELAGEIKNRRARRRRNSRPRNFRGPLSQLLCGGRHQRRRASGLLARRRPNRREKSAGRHRAGHFSAALRADQSAGRRNGPARTQRLPRTILGFRHSRRNFLFGMDCSRACRDWKKDLEIGKSRGQAVRAPVRHFRRLARLVCPGHRRIQLLHPGAGLDGLHAARLLAGSWTAEISSTKIRRLASLLAK